MKIAILGGGGVRTPIVIYGLAQAQAALGTTEVVLFDIDAGRLNVIARLGREVLRGFDNPFEIRIETDLLRTAEGAAFVLSSIRVGGMSARARDERIAIEYGLAGQETTGPGGAAMALRTLPVTLAQAQAVERVAPRAWFINFTNPAGLITQALTQNTSLKVIGICDTPSELFHAIANGIGEPQSDMTFDYAGLNHLGWIRHVHLRGEEITERILDDTELLRQLYPADLFDPELIQTLRLIPTEYLFFYYSQRRAYQNQLRAGASRGEELSRLNAGFFEELGRQGDSEALASYRQYLMRRNASYMQLEAQAGSAFGVGVGEQDPFELATGYHRIALELMQGLVSDSPREVVLNVLNGDTIADLRWDDVVEVPCRVDRRGARPKRAGALPDSVRGLVQSVKGYERTLIRAALSGSSRLAELAMLEYPIIGQWELAKEVLQALCKGDAQFLGYLH
ncbi:MAG TPA: 6-phospho-beta-glucosidase [Bryobacteraceae bacterium]|jgi:6-phospho-beta-glucosidase|nr:6-phospho-beta-glucosidase [Bryobacteraceae bacterium]